MTVDGTDCLVQQQGAAIEGNPFGSHKYAGKSALRYELGVSILGGDLVWIQGHSLLRACPQASINRTLNENRTMILGMYGILTCMFYLSLSTTILEVDRAILNNRTPVHNQAK